MTEHVPSKEKLEHLRHLRVLLKCGEYDGAHIMQAWLALDEYAAMLERAADEPCEGPFVVADGGSTGENRFRTMKQGFSAWTLDINEALQFARRKDAELFAAEDDEAWQVLPVPTERSAAEPKPTGAGLISGTTVGASCSPAASSSTQPPAAPLQWYGIYGHLVPVSPNGVADTALRVDRKSAHDVYLKDDVDRLLAQRAAQPPFPAPKFNVGDKVRMAGMEREVVGLFYRYRVSSDLGRNGWTAVDESSLEPYSGATKEV